MNDTYRLSSIVDSTDLQVFGSREASPIRLLIRAADGERVCAVRSDAGPAVVGNLTVEEAIARWGADDDDAMRDALTAR